MSAELLARLDRFDIDGEAVALPFAARLAREHGWPRRFADRVVTEYKRFAYLAASAGYPVTPSQAVDHCWHLHLCYTRSYWERFCRDVLSAPLHHTPTAGGPAERRRYHAQYERTLAAYQSAFGHAPPADIWPPAAVRFGDDLREVTVNTAAHWVVPKAGVWRAAAAVGVAGLATVGAAGCVGGLNPFALNGVEFFGFLVPAMLAAVAAGLVLRAWAKGGPAGEPPALDWQAVALLAGGPQRLLAATVARLADRGAAAVSLAGTHLETAGPLPADATPAERAAWAALPISRTYQDGMLGLAKAVGGASAEVRETLDAAGLTLTDAASKRVGWLSLLPLGLVLLLFGLPRLITGLANGKPVGFLVAALVAGGVVALVLRSKRPYRTWAGDRLVKELTARPATEGDLGLTVAVLGTAALAGTGLAALHAWYPRKAAAGGDGGSIDSGCGTSGDGGGGGGCGGGGGGGD